MFRKSKRGLVRLKLTRKICVCGREKEDSEKRYCRRCGKEHGELMHHTHAGKGSGPRRKYGKRRPKNNPLQVNQI